jgi:imidazoleglycerol-phosphate dehydratase/histidinol-phosphatase
VKRALFIDRDNTILVEPADEQIDAYEKLVFVPGVIGALSRIRRDTDFEFVLVTNQDGLGTESFPEEDFWPVQNLMLSILESEGVVFDAVFIDRSFEHEKSPGRKPGTAMLESYRTGYDLQNSFVIGDRATDVQLAANLGCRAIQVAEEGQSSAELVTTDWDLIYRHVRAAQRTASVLRETDETRIDVRLALDGSGLSDVNTGLGFFDHMLDQIARHSSCNMNISAHGDLHVDEHHLIEDTGLALGQAFREALGDRKGIVRYAFVLPMDESLAHVALDWSGRPWLEWNVPFAREHIGDVPTEMFYHFFKSFCDTARCTLNIRASGRNEHHIIEAVFKGFGRVLGQASAVDYDATEIPSTKGSL